MHYLRLFDAQRTVLNGNCPLAARRFPGRWRYKPLYQIRQTRNIAAAGQVSHFVPHGTPLFNIVPPDRHSAATLNKQQPMLRQRTAQ
jgi:hypothetical protein